MAALGSIEGDVAPRMLSRRRCKTEIPVAVKEHQPVHWIYQEHGSHVLREE